MKSYEIIDEPKPGTLENLVVDPSAILLVSIVVPMLWMPPLFGKFWIPLVWLMANSHFMGSPTFRKELLTSAAGMLAMVLIFFGAGVVFQQFGHAEKIGPYFMLILHGVFFLTMYLVVFMQSAPYAIHQYVKAQRQH